MNCKTSICFQESIQNDNCSLIQENKENESTLKIYDLQCVRAYLATTLAMSKKTILVSSTVSSSVLLSDKKCENRKAKNNKQGTSGSVMKSCDEQQMNKRDEIKNKAVNE